MTMFEIKYRHIKPLLSSLFLIFALLSFFNGYSQTFKIEGSVLDSETRQPISGASLIVKNSSRGTSTNDQGVFKFELIGFPAVLFIQCMGYLRDTVVIENESQYIAAYKNQNPFFLLKQSPIQINEVQVKARTTLFEKDPYSIIDYKIVGQRIVALGYKNGNEFRKEVLLADLSGKMISNQRVKNLDSLFQDCQGHLFAFCSDSALELKLTQKQVSIRNGYQRSFIVNFIAPVCGISDSMIFLKKSSANHQYDNYYAVSDSQNVMLIYSTGGLMKERQVNNIRNNWKTIARIPVTAGNHDFLVPEGGIMLQWFLRSYEGIYKRAFSLQHQLTTDFRSVFTKMIPYGKNQLIFDREAATIYRLDEKGEVIIELGMITKLNGIYYEDVHLDIGTGRIYLEYPQGPFTHFIEINPETGQEVRRFMVTEFKHIEKSEFHNDRLYFLYQPDSGKRIKKVFSIRI